MKNPAPAVAAMVISFAIFTFVAAKCDTPPHGGPARQPQPSISR